MTGTYRKDSRFGTNEDSYQQWISQNAGLLNPNYYDGDGYGRMIYTVLFFGKVNVRFRRIADVPLERIGTASRWRTIKVHELLLTMYRRVKPHKRLLSGFGGEPIGRLNRMTGRPLFDEIIWVST